MFETLEQQYKRQLNNWLVAVAQTIHSVQFGQSTYEDKLKALDVIQKQLADAKRAVMFLMNREKK